ncbi:hypothetical protein ANANG_G00057100 [Anguilla anguilla]|uniref:Uncharacterized protein n=1 Tax=Anguilla anguilla TaxID=7936 RepID=A0A9D3MSH4_ANGAN|nr:hypothetical protein ANANG_G00057100 [Anguilla anguilla]
MIRVRKRQLCRDNIVNQPNSDVTMNHMFTISDNESENSDDAAEADQSKGKPGDEVTLPDITLSAPAHDRLRLYSDSQASTGSQAEDGDLPGGAVFDEGGGAAETPPIRGRSRSAPPSAVGGDAIRTAAEAHERRVRHLDGQRGHEEIAESSSL